MKTLEHEIRDVLNKIQLDERKKSSKPNSSSTDNALDVTSLVPGPVGMAASGEIARRAFTKGNYSDAALAALGIIPGLGRATSVARVSSRVAKNLRIRKRPKTAKRKGGKGNDKRKGSGGKWGRRLAALGAGGGSPSKARDDSGYTNPDDYKPLSSVWTGGRPPKRITVESREDIEATPRFTETDREKIDVVPRAENDLDTANRKRFRMENIKKKIIDESLNIINSRK